MQGASPTMENRDVKFNFKFALIDGKAGGGTP